MYSLAIEFKKEWVILNDGSRRCQLNVRLDQVLRVEALIVHVDSLNELLQVVLLDNARPERFLADWTVGAIRKPLIDALAVKYVIAV